MIERFFEGIKFEHGNYREFLLGLNSGRHIELHFSGHHTGNIGKYHWSKSLHQKCIEFMPLLCVFKDMNAYL